MMMMEENGKLLFSLPGVPYEVKPLIKDQIIPYLKDKFSLHYLSTRIVSVVGIPKVFWQIKLKTGNLPAGKPFIVLSSCRNPLN
jgi:nicotinamide-nucleotide amidase